MKQDPDAWLRKEQPTAELCRLFHGIDCRLCSVVRVRKLPRLLPSVLIEEFWI